MAGVGKEKTDLIEDKRRIHSLSSNIHPSTHILSQKGSLNQSNPSLTPKIDAQSRGSRPKFEYQVN